jgi:hypothetical protein
MVFASAKTILSSGWFVGRGEHGGKFLWRLGGARSAEVLAAQQNGYTDCPCQVNEWLWRFINKKPAMQLIARSERFAEAVTTAPQIQALRGTNSVVIVIFTAPATAACPEIKALC